MYSNVEASLTLECVRPTHDTHLHKTSNQPSDEKFHDIFKEKSDHSTRFNKKTISNSEHAESPQPRKKQDFPPEGEEKDRHCRSTTQTSLSGRVLRNRRSRRIFDDNRHTKRLFTPEIKKFLKDWLIRRREHPYPNRDEKKKLAVETGLTYIQICNWFANWRRKLKNAGCSDDQRTWTHLIQSYNTTAEGNVEQISITSDDSIWDRRDLMDEDDIDDEDEPPASTFTTSIAAMDHSYSVLLLDQANPASPSLDVPAPVPAQVTAPGGTAVSLTSENQPQCFTISSTTTEDEEVRPRQEKRFFFHHVPIEKLTCNHMQTDKYTSHHMSTQNMAYHPSSVETRVENTGGLVPTGKNKYKRHIMEKYMNDLRHDTSTLALDVGERETNWKTEGPSTKRLREAEANSSDRDEQYRTCGGKRSCWQEGKKKKGVSNKTKEVCPPVVLSKWLESAAKFKPTKSYAPWTATKNVTWPKKTRKPNFRLQGEAKASFPASSTKFWASRGHQRAELDAAEALTFLSASHR